MNTHEMVQKLSESFASCTNILTAIGDETRQYLILKMMKIGKGSGVRVCEITSRTNLSRPAVSHHLQIMKNAVIVKVRKEGTKNYYFDPGMESFGKLVKTLELAMSISKQMPNRSETN